MMRRTLPFSLTAFALLAACQDVQSPTEPPAAAAFAESADGGLVLKTVDLRVVARPHPQSIR